MKTNVNSTVAVEESTTDNSGKDVYDESNTTAPTIPFCETSRNSNLDNKDNNNLAMVAAESNILLDPEVQHASHEAFEQYTWASSAVVQIINTGLVELVRQVSCECLERGSLLDCLRQLLVDVVESHIRVLHYAKSRAFNEAQWRLQESEQKREMEKQMHEACERAHALEMENASLLKSQEQLKLKASRLDDLVERVHAKREKFDIHTEDEHAALLKMIEDDLTSSAGAALSKLYDLQFDLEKESNNNADDANSTKTTTLATKERKEAPSASEARKKLEEQQHANEQLYHNSYQLLNTLTDAVEAVNAACAPLYDEVILKEVSSMANVAAAKWATIARAIGSFEREQTHRQRVFQIFSEWCDRFRHRNHQHEHRASQSVSVNVNNASDHSHSSLIDSHYYNNNNNNNNNNENRDENEDMPNEQMRYLTTSDLAKMHVSDVSADEVNAMFARDFDFNAYLDTEWRHSSSSSLSSNCTLTTADVNCMIHDTQVILHEIVLRLNAIAHSSIVWKGSQPPLQAPSHPLDPCVLCGRCDVVLEEKQKRQGALRAIASEVQSQIEELTNKCQHAEAERQSSRAQLKTLREELEHAKSEITLLKQELNTLQTSNGMKQISSTINSPSSLSPSSLEMVNASNMAPTSVFTIGRKNRLTRKTNTSLSSSSVHSVKSNSPRQPQQPLQETQSRRRHNNYYYRQQQQQQQQQLQSQRRDSNTLVSSSSTLSTLSPSPPPLASSPSINSSVENTVIMTDTLVFGTNTSTDISNNNNSNVIAMTNDPHYLSDAPPSLEHTMTDVNTPHVGDNNSVKESEQKR